MEDLEGFYKVEVGKRGEEYLTTEEEEFTTE
jgi:hypothetical protein